MDWTEVKSAYNRAPMSDFIFIAKQEEIPLGRMVAFPVEGKRITIYHTARGFFATDNSCPHRGGPLVEGDLMGNEVVCPWHLWGFDLETGRNDRFPEVAVTTHEVKLEGDSIFVRLNNPREQV